jgi:periplasmic divalent cation tolerance protein
MEPLIVLVTASGADEASRIASALVEERLAACVNVIANLHSTYRWQGRVEQTDEWLLVIKSARHLLPALEARVRLLHSYTVPEVVALPIVGGSEAYLRWLEEQVQPAPGDDRAVPGT